MNNRNETEQPRHSNCIVATLKAYETKITSGDFYPVYYGIEVTRHCNFACIMCPNPYYTNTEKGHMDIDLFKKIIDEISPFAEAIKLHWVGEPLLHPELRRMVDYARDKTNAQLYLSTNGSLLYGEKAKQIRESGIDKLTISLDGASPNAYGMIRKNGDYLKVFKNVYEFVSAVDREGGPLCHIQLIQQNANVSETEKFEQIWSHFRNVIVDVTWLSDWAGNVPGARSLSNFHNPIAQLPRTACSDLWFKMQIDWQGRVALCCFDANGSVNLGDFTTGSLPKIWQTNKIKALRSQHLENNFSGICLKCLDWASQTEYEFWYTSRELVEDPQIIWSVGSQCVGR